jgi:SAM-dependent methyltransferase
MHQFLLRPIRAVYYRAGFLRRSSVGNWLRTGIQNWEISEVRGDCPKDKAGWEKQFESGQWEYLARESARYGVIVGFIEQFKGDGEILDVGCGQGFLYRHFRPYGYRRYDGIDISEAAVARLAGFADERTHFTQGDGDRHEPTQPYDLIVFNESLYYLREPICSLQRYARSLKRDGALIISNYTESRRARALLDDATRAFPVVEEATTTQGRTSWRCVVMRPARQ